MRALALCVCVLVLASFSVAEVKQQLQGAIKQQHFQEAVLSCFIEHNFTPDYSYSEEDIMTNVHTQPENEERTRRNGCVIACVLKKLHMMDGSKIKEEKIHEEIDNQVPEGPHIAKIHKIAHKCVKEVKNITQECEKSFGLFICVAKAAHRAEGHEEHEVHAEEEEQNQ